jgi:4-amino-4-deoxy-L-arabinose transferase-like glycosyltransferase
VTPDSAPAEATPGHWYIPGQGGGFLSSRGATAFELVLVSLIALAVLVPGIWSYSLVDPWETHYGEVARRMLQDHDWVHTTWSNEGFRSKPVLTFWLMAASMKAMGIAQNGGYSGELTNSEWVMFAIRLPFALFGAMGLVLTWWMLARQVSRRVAWLALLVIGTTPFYFFVARQGITDMTMVSCLIGTMACFVMALHAGDEPIARVWRRVDAFHVYLAALLLLVGWQIVYYGYFFARYPQLGGGVRVWHPEILLPGAMLIGLAGFLAWSIFLQPTRSMRQVYMYWAWTLLGVSVLGKGLAAFGLSMAIGGLYILVTWNWRLILDLELIRGFYLVLLIAIPWHFGMWMKEGRGFIQEYVIQHNLNRAASGVHGDRGTFDYYLSQVGIGMWPWVALLPAAIARTVTVATSKVREHRVRFVVGIWAIAAVAMFVIVQTKFHHYILPAVPAMG